MSIAADLGLIDGATGDVICVETRFYRKIERRLDDEGESARRMLRMAVQTLARRLLP
jgi:hypothetical protein